MTEEHPQRSATDPVYCDTCNAAVRLERDEVGLLEVRCACGESRSVKVAAKVPDGWSG